MKTRKERLINIVLRLTFLFLIVLNIATTCAYLGCLREGLDYLGMALFGGIFAMVLFTGPYLFCLKALPPKPERSEGEPGIEEPQAVSLRKMLTEQKRRLGRRAIGSLLTAFGCFWLGLRFLTSGLGLLEFYLKIYFGFYFYLHLYKEFCALFLFFCIIFFIFSFLVHAWAWWAQRRKSRKCSFQDLTEREASWLLEVSEEIGCRSHYACESGLLYMMAVLAFISIA